MEEGEVLLCKENNFHAPFLKLKGGSYFGEFAFFADEKPKFSAISSKFSTIYTLTKRDFLTIIKENNKDYVKLIKKNKFLHNFYYKGKVLHVKRSNKKQ